MGLIKMFTSAVGSTFADQVVEYFRCEDMSTKILCQPATLVKRGKTVNNGTEGVISNGSRFDVAVNQAALLIENGRVHDFVIGTQETAGQYKYDSTVSPSLLGGGWGDLGASIKEIGRRFTAGGQAMNTMRLIYINLRPLPGNKIGFGKIPFRDGEMNLTLNAQGHGQYMLCVRQGLHRPLNLTHIQPVPAKGQRDAHPRQQQPPAPVPGNHEPAAGEQKSSHRAWQQPYGAQQILGQKNPQGKAPGEDGQLTHRFPISPSALKAPLRVFHRGLQSCRASERESVSAACTLSGYTPPGKSPAVVRLVSSPLPAVPVSSSLPPHRTA